MAMGTHSVPMEFQDEDKWLKFFNKVQIIALGLTLGIGVLIIRGFAAIHATAIGVFIAIILLIVVGIIVMVNIPNSKYLWGGGQKVSTILLRLILRRFKRTIYTKNYNSEIEEKMQK